MNFQLFKRKFLIFSCYDLIFSCPEKDRKRTNRDPCASCTTCLCVNKLLANRHSPAFLQPGLLDAVVQLTIGSREDRGGKNGFGVVC